MTAYYSERSIELATELHKLALANIARFEREEAAAAGIGTEVGGVAVVDNAAVVTVPASTRSEQRARG